MTPFSGTRRSVPELPPRNPIPCGSPGQEHTPAVFRRGSGGSPIRRHVRPSYVERCGSDGCSKSEGSREPGSAATKPLKPMTILALGATVR